MINLKLIHNNGNNDNGNNNKAENYLNAITE